MSKHIHFDGLLKPNILEQLKIFKGIGLGSLNCDGIQISFNPDIQSLLGTKMHDCTTHGNNVFLIYEPETQKKSWVFIHPSWQESYITGDCNTFQIDVLDELPPKYIMSGQRTVMDWYEDKLYTRIIERVCFYGTNRSGKMTAKIDTQKRTLTDMDFTFDIKTIEFIVFTFTNGLKFFMVHKWFGQTVLYFDLDISVATFIEKYKYKDRGWDIVLQHEI